MVPGNFYPRVAGSFNKQAKHKIFHKFEEGISFAEHWKLVVESSEFHLTLERAHRVYFFNSKYAKKKRDIFRYSSLGSR